MKCVKEGIIGYQDLIVPVPFHDTPSGHIFGIPILFEYLSSYGHSYGLIRNVNKQLRAPYGALCSNTITYGDTPSHFLTHSLMHVITRNIVTTVGRNGVSKMSLIGDIEVGGSVLEQPCVS